MSEKEQSLLGFNIINVPNKNLFHCFSLRKKAPLAERSFFAAVILMVEPIDRYKSLC